MRRMLVGYSLIIWQLFSLTSAEAYNLTPIYEETENQLEAASHSPLTGFFSSAINDLLDQFSDPAHEGLTARIYGCKESFEACGDAPENYVPDGVLDGLRWNDNPIFRLSSTSPFCPKAHEKGYFLDLDSDPICWATLFHDAKKRASRKQEHFSGSAGSVPVALIYRVHFGDLQFFHSMASWNGERASDTQTHVLAWAEFTYKVAGGEIQSLDAPIVSFIPALKEQFARNGFSARTLFVPNRSSRGPAGDANLREMALGSLLHTIEDSFSEAHVSRDTSSSARTCEGAAGSRGPGRILAFYAYNQQSGSLHKVKDKSDMAAEQLQEPANAVEVGANVVAMLKSGKKWDEAAPYFRCVFDITDPTAIAGPGPFAQ